MVLRAAGAMYLLRYYARSLVKRIGGVGDLEFGYKRYRLRKQNQLGCRVRIDRKEAEERASSTAFSSKVKFLSIE